ncbi:Rrf2 family transcriptional regulator [bacterium]|nr:MAG: Rrf2 family transcriptional regulator [bacterium]
MALLSKSCVYGIRASIYIASEAENDFISISQVAKELNLSPHFLTKILQQLSNENLLLSHKGPKGGVKFARDTKDIKLIEIIGAIDGMDLFTQCALGLEGCGIYKPCPLHDSWTVHRNLLKELFETENLYDLSKNVKNAGLRLRTLNNDELLKLKKSI